VVYWACKWVGGFSVSGGISWVVLGEYGLLDVIANLKETYDAFISDYLMVYLYICYY